MRHVPKHATRGATLAELMICVAIVAILAAVAAPAVRAWMSEGRVRAAVSALSAHTSLARAKAVGQRTPVTVAPLGAEWDGGWLVFVDEDRDGQWSGGESVLARQEPFAAVAIRAKGPLRKKLTFGSLGSPVQANGAFLAGTFKICSDGAPYDVHLVMSASGRVREERVSPSACG